MIFGGLCAAIVLLLIIAVAFIAYTGRGLDKESKTYADAAVVAIASQWNEQDLTDRASPQFMATVKDPADLDRVVGVWRTLGPLKKYDGSKGEANINLGRRKDHHRRLRGASRIRPQFGANQDLADKIGWSLENPRFLCRPGFVSQSRRGETRHLTVQPESATEVAAAICAAARIWPKWIVPRSNSSSALIMLASAALQVGRFFRARVSGLDRATIKFFR